MEWYKWMFLGIAVGFAIITATIVIRQVIKVEAAERELRERENADESSP